MPITKTLLTCSPREFLVQTNRMKKAVEKWATLTDIKNLINRKAEGIEALTGDADKDTEIKARNTEKASKQGIINLSAIMDAALEQYTDETLEIIALMFFMTPAELDEIQSRDMMRELNALLSDEVIADFFTSLSSAVRTATAR